MKEYTRLESDSIGEMEIPENAYYGVQSLRARENFPITGAKLHPFLLRISQGSNGQQPSPTVRQEN